jgi:hypothetical protein
MGPVPAFGVGGREEQCGTDALATQPVGERIITSKQGVMCSTCCLCVCRYEAPDGRRGNSSYTACMSLVQQVLPRLICDARSYREQGKEGTDVDASMGSSSSTHQQGQAPSTQQQHLLHAAGRRHHHCTLGGVHIPPVDGIEFLAIEVSQHLPPMDLACFTGVMMLQPCVLLLPWLLPNRISSGPFAPWAWASMPPWQRLRRQGGSTAQGAGRYVLVQNQHLALLSDVAPMLPSHTQELHDAFAGHVPDTFIVRCECAPHAMRGI